MRKKLRLLPKKSREQRHLELKYKRLFPETGDRLWAFRETRGLTQKAMGEEVGVSAGCISRIECGYTMGYSKTIANMCRVLGLSADFLLNLSDDQRIHDPVLQRRRAAL
jgi:transcriptional regulator with XRE-family HTH domain